MPKAEWNNVVIAQSDHCEIVEGNYYFPPDAINMAYFKTSDHQMVCHWKGVASYYHLAVNGKINENAAWYYPEPKPAASNIKGYVAFWKGVQIKD